MSFWTESPCELFSNFVIFPTVNMTKDEKLNAITRLLIIITVLLYALEYEHWLLFGLAGIVGIVLLKYMKIGGGEGYIEGFSLPATYNSPDISTITVAPAFSSEWAVNVPAYDIYDNSAPDYSDSPIELIPPSSYPYGQLRSNYNQIPSDEFDMEMNSCGARSARSFANTSFMRRNIQQREDVMRLHKKRLARRFRAQSGDVFSPYSSS